MKKSLPFFAGMFTTVLITGLSISALAATGQLTITVDPINIQVNGRTFQPKDAQGKDVPVFAYDGTTYAPLRALAEAYGLEVGYDAASNMATVKDTGAVEEPTTPEESSAPETYNFDYSYEEFKGLWEVTEHNETLIFVAIDDSKTIVWWDSIDSSTRDEHLLRAAEEGLKEFGLASNLMSIFRINSIDNMATVYWGEVHYKN